jgi:hypothetical protein
MYFLRPASASPALVNVKHAHALTHSRTMNSLYTLGAWQSSSIQADLERMRGGNTSASLLCLTPPRAARSLAEMSRTTDGYASMARREVIQAKEEKATSYVPFLVREKKKAMVAIYRS